MLVSRNMRMEMGDIVLDSWVDCSKLGMFICGCLSEGVHGGAEEG